MRLEADKAEAELAALRFEKNASQQTIGGISTTGISTSVVTSNIDNHSAIDDGIGNDILTAPASVPTPTTVAGQGFETNKRERQFVSPGGVVPVAPALHQSLVQSLSPQTGIPQPNPSPSSTQSQGVLEEYQHPKTHPQTPPLSDGAVSTSALTSLRHEAEELRMAELAVLAERNMVRTVMG